MNQNVSNETQCQTHSQSIGSVVRSLHIPNSRRLAYIIGCVVILGAISVFMGILTVPDAKMLCATAIGSAVAAACGASIARQGFPGIVVTTLFVIAANILVGIVTALPVGVILAFVKAVIG